MDCIFGILFPRWSTATETYLQFSPHGSFGETSPGIFTVFSDEGLLVPITDCILMYSVPIGLKCLVGTNPFDLQVNHVKGWE